MVGLYQLADPKTANSNSFFGEVEYQALAAATKEVRVLSEWVRNKSKEQRWAKTTKVASEWPQIRFCRKYLSRFDKKMFMEMVEDNIFS